MKVGRFLQKNHFQSLTPLCIFKGNLRGKKRERKGNLAGLLDFICRPEVENLQGGWTKNCN